MKVALIQETIAPERGGAETSTVEMARHLARLGLDVWVLYRGDASAPFIRDNVTFRPLAVSGPTRSLKTYRFVQAALRACREERFDLVHAVTPCLNADVYQPRGGTFAETAARNAARVGSSPQRLLRALGQRFNVRRQFLYRMEQTLLTRRSARVMVAALSEYVRRQVVEGYGFPAERVRVIFNGVEPPGWREDAWERERSQRRAELGAGPDSRVLLFAAHNFKLKGLDRLIAALAAPAWRTLMGTTDWLLVVAGRDDPGPCRRLAERSGLGAQVRFIGPQANLPGWYAAADLLAHPTWYDPCSRVVLEALCCGLPVVTTRYNGAAEIMESGRHGFVVDEPGDAGALAAALVQALSPGVRDACRADAPRLRTRLSMSRHAEELKNLYEEIVAARKG